MSSMFGGGFKAAKCKTLLRLAMARIKLLRNKRDIQVKQMRKDIAQLLMAGQEPSARIRVEHIAREQNIMAAYDILELFCELIIVRLPIIESQKICPMDLKEAICSVIFASPRCADLPELLQIRGLFASKYGKEFVAAAAELRPDCGVNRRIIEKLSVRAPSGEVKLKLLTEIAAEHNVSWDPADSEAELLKQPEDLLDGPKKFFGASSTPISEPHPSPPKPDVSDPHPEKTAMPPQAPAAVSSSPSPKLTPQPSGQLSASDSEDDTASSDKKQFIPFVKPSELPSKVTERPSTAKGSTSGKLDSTVSSSKEDSSGRVRKDGQMDYHEPHNMDYRDVAAAAKAAAESADRAVAAANAAAVLAKTHPSRRASEVEVPKTQPSGRAIQDTDSSDDSDDSEEEQRSETKSSVRREHDPVRPERNVSFSIPEDQDKSDGLFRSNSNDKQEGSSRKSNIKEGQAGAFRRSTGEYDRQEMDTKSGRTFDSEETSFWRSGDQDWWPEKKLDRDGFPSSQGDEHKSLNRRNSDLFKGTGPEERANDKDRYTGTSSPFRAGSDEVDLRSSDEAPFYEAKQGFASPKFDDEELPYGKDSLMSNNRTDDLSFRRDLDSTTSKPAVNEFWQTSWSHPDQGQGTTRRNYGSFGSYDHGSDKPGSSSFSTFDIHLDESQRLTQGTGDSLLTKSFDKADSSKYNEPKEPSTVPTKSRRTRNPPKSRDRLEGGSPSVGLSPPQRKPPKFSTNENVESLAPRSPEYQSLSDADIHQYDDSPKFSTKSSLPFYNSPSVPSDRTAPSSNSSDYQSPDTNRETSPSVVGSSSARSSPSLERKDSPSAPPVHPKLPDYDDLAARFEALKGRAKR